MEKLEVLWSVAQTLCDGLNFMPVCDNQQLTHSIGEYLLEEVMDYINTYHDGRTDGLTELEAEVDRRLKKIYPDGVPSAIRVYDCDLWDAVAELLNIERD